MNHSATALLAMFFFAAPLCAQGRKTLPPAQPTLPAPTESMPTYSIPDITPTSTTPLGTPSEVSCLHWTLPRAASSTVSANALQAPAKARDEYAKACSDLHSLKLSQAESHLRKSVRLYPDYAEAWTVLGQVLAAQTRLSDAESACAQASIADAHFAPAQLCLADLSAQQDHWRDALDHADRAILIAPVQNVFGQYYCALSYFHLNRLSDAEHTALLTADSDRTHRVPEVHLLLAQIYGQKRDFASATAQLREFLLVAPQSSAAPSVQRTLAQLEPHSPQ